VNKSIDMVRNKKKLSPIILLFFKTTITGNCISILIALRAALVTLSIAYHACSSEVLWNIFFPAVVSGTTE
jgi:hypothetical protein